MKLESAPSYKRVIRELYGDVMHPDFDRAGGTSPEEHKAMVRLSHRLKPYERGEKGRFVRKRECIEAQASAEKKRWA